MKVWNNGRFENIELGQKVFVGYCGSGRTVFGEYGHLERITKQHLIFKVESGATIKTKIDNLHDVIGKAGKQGWFVSTKIDREFIESKLYVY